MRSLKINSTSTTPIVKVYRGACFVILDSSSHSSALLIPVHLSGLYASFGHVQNAKIHILSSLLDNKLFKSKGFPLALSFKSYRHMCCTSELKWEMWRLLTHPEIKIANCGWETVLWTGKRLRDKERHSRASLNTQCQQQGQAEVSPDLC